MVRSLAAVWLVLMGLSIGSFLNVVIARVPEGLSIVKPRSRCPRCGHQLSWWENIPVLSWVLLRGRCRGCQLPISLQYPAVELLTGALYLACLWRFDWSWDLVRALMLVTLLIPLSFIDLQHWILPFSLTLPGIALGLVLAIPDGSRALVDAAIGAGGGFLVFWAMEWVGEKIFKKEALGGGDKFLLALLCAFLTWRALLGIIFFASFQGAVVGIVLLAIFGRAGPAPREEATADEGQPQAAPGPSTEAPPVRSNAESGATAELPAQRIGREVTPVEDAGTASSPSTEHPALAHTAAAPEAPAAADDAESDEEDDWVPGPTNIPFGPWLAVAALELMLLGPWLSDLIPWQLGWFIRL